MLWNEPNNLSHWNFEIDPGWEIYAKMVNAAADAVRAERPALRRVLGGISPIDPEFIKNLKQKCVLGHVDVVAVHGFPLDWNHWTIHEWPDKLREIQAVTDLPLWVSEVGVSTFGAEEVQEFGLRRTAELLIGRAERIHWYSLYDLPRAWPATTRHREAEGSAYYRHFYMGLVREDGSPKLAMKQFHEYTPEIGHLPVVSFRGPSPRRRRVPPEGPRREAPAHRPELGGQLPPECRRVVRPPDESARAVRHHHYLLLHARASRHSTESHEPAAGRRRVCGILRAHDTALRVK